MKALIALILIALGAGLFFGFTDPHYQHLKNLQLQAADYNQALSQSKILLAQRQALSDQYDQIDPTSLDRIKKLVPDSVDNVRLIIDINGIAARRGMTIKSIRIAGASGGTNQNAIGPDNNPYGSISLTFSVTAPYDRFKQFLKDLEQSLRLVDITSLSFGSSDKSDQYDYSITLRTYWLKH